MPTFTLYQIDAFASRVFSGNPAAVVPLGKWPDDAVLTRIAAENNLSETAFFSGEHGNYRIRWFAPVGEVDLCGHATLASAYVITRFLEPDVDSVHFDSPGGELIVRRTGEALELDFPSRPAYRAEDALASRIRLALGVPVPWCGRTRNPDPDSDKLLAVLDSATAVETLAPDAAALKGLPGQGLVVTARGIDCDFVSRYFVPKLDIPEDPVTGSAHCTLAPYWAEILGKQVFFARQVSARGGELWCRLVGDRVRIAGRCVPYLEGRITVPAES